MSRIFNSDVILEPCKKCDGSTYIKTRSNEVMQVEGVDLHCECYMHNKLLDANVGFDYWDIESETWQGHQEDLDSITKYYSKIHNLKQEGRGLYLYGSYGVGKTSLAIMLLKHILRTTNYTGLFVPFSELVILNSKIMNGWHNKDIEQAIMQIKNKDFLILDDLTKEYDNERDNGRATLNSILRYRDLWRKSTIYTANIPMGDTKDKYGMSNFSVIRGRSTMITMRNQVDYRVKRKTTFEDED